MNKKAAFFEQVVIITGASSGIGRQLAFQLADQGAWLTLAARRAEALETVATLCSQRGGRALVVPTDVSDQSHCQRLIEQTVAEYGRLDVLINNAGMRVSARFDEMHDLELIEQMMRVNYLGSVYCTHYALPALTKTQGRLVGVASLSGKWGVPTRSGYAASKHALAGFFDALRLELADTGVSVTMAYPGFIATETHAQALGADGKPLGTSRVSERKMMTTATCARLILQAAAKRQREVIMTLQGKVGVVLYRIMPGFVDRMIRNTFQES